MIRQVTFGFLISMMSSCLTIVTDAPSKILGVFCTFPPHPPHNRGLGNSSRGPNSSCPCIRNMTSSCVALSVWNAKAVFPLSIPVLGPLLFIMYTTPLSSFISSLSLNHHLYADDTQLFFSFHPPYVHSSLTHLHGALKQISSWMTSNLSTLNSSKTEFLFIGLKQQLAKLQNISLNTTHSARNLGFIFDDKRLCYCRGTARRTTSVEILWPFFDWAIDKKLC